MFIHPKYKSGNGFDWDICLVKVTNLTNAKPSSCNNCFGAACLPRELPDLHGRHCWVAGWGLNKEGGSGKGFNSMLVRWRSQPIKSKHQFESLSQSIQF